MAAPIRLVTEEMLMENYKKAESYMLSVAIRGGILAGTYQQTMGVGHYPEGTPYRKSTYEENDVYTIGGLIDARAPPITWWFFPLARNGCQRDHGHG